eukprot:s1357_g5.t1
MAQLHPQYVVSQDKYDMSIAAAFYSPKLNFSVASGYTDAGLGMGNKSRLAKEDDEYVWGSTTKMFTAPAVLQLVEQGKVQLDDPIAAHIDPILWELNHTKLEHHFGSPIQQVQIQHLLHMTSGIQDYDGEAFSKAQFANRSKAFGPVETWQKLAGMRPPCGTRPYSSFILSGPCKYFTPVHGFMEFYPSAQLPKQDVWDVSCLGGWTAGNYVGSVADVARFTYELYNTKMLGMKIHELPGFV